jgi:hypothetical protein
MFPGFNTNVPYKDRLFHIQTEDSGTQNPVITSLLYNQGAIIASKKASYSHLVGSEDCRAKVLQMMRAQHQGMVRDLLAGRYTGEAPPEPPAEPEERDIDEIFLDYVIRAGRG